MDLKFIGLLAALGSGAAFFLLKGKSKKVSKKKKVTITEITKKKLLAFQSWILDNISISLPPSTKNSKIKSMGVDLYNEIMIGQLDPRFRETFAGYVGRMQTEARAHGQEIVIFESSRPISRGINNLEKGTSKTIKSKHLVGAAIDLVMWTGKSVSWTFPEWYEEEAARLSLIFSLIWGGTFKSFRDLPHVEIHNSRLSENQRIALTTLDKKLRGIA